MKKVKILIIGAGSRGRGYSEYIDRNRDAAEVVGVAEPDDGRREYVKRMFDLPPDAVFTDWKDAAGRERFADAVIISTQDAMHVEPAVEFAELGYHILLEKPMAPEPEGCVRIAEAVTRNNVIFEICHVLRYTSYTRKLKEIVDSGAIGRIVCMQHYEPVGYWHQAHSYVRGSWRNEKESSSMLLAKSCHDIDWLLYIMGENASCVSSFGGLNYFREENRPEGAADRCIGCAVEGNCPYSAKKIYLEGLESGNTGWPVDVIADPVTRENVLDALESGPYGRCVFACDNDVVDNQIVCMAFPGNRNVTFCMTGFSEYEDRKTVISGTGGSLYGDGTKIEVTDFLTDRTEEHRIEASSFSIVGGHAGGDDGLMDNFIKKVAEGRQSSAVSDALNSHLHVFAAEESRKKGKIIDVKAV